MPSRSLPASVYWRRRLVLLTIAVLVFVGLGKALSHSTGSNDHVQRTADLPKPTLTLTSTPPGPVLPAKSHKATKPRRTPTVPPTPVLADPVGTCADNQIAVTPSIPQATAGQDVPVLLTMRSLASPACTWQVSARVLAVRITSGSDFIWSSQQCPVAIPSQTVIVRSAVATQITVHWNAKRSDPSCSRYSEWALPGWYHVASAAYGGNRDDAQFKLEAPSPSTVYVTKTAAPKPSRTSTPSGR